MMNELEIKHIKVLELPKVLERLAAFCASEEAKQNALQLLPGGDYDEVAERLSETSAASSLIARYGAPSFGGLCDLSDSFSRASAGGALMPGELLAVSSLLHTIRGLTEWRAHCADTSTVLDSLFSALSPNKYLEDCIDTAIISEEEISDQASPELANLRRKKRAASSRIRDRLDHMIRSASVHKYLQDPIVTLRSGRFVIPVRAECRNEVPGLVHDTSSSGATLFIEPMAVVEANNEIRVLESKEQAEIERILAELSVQVGNFSEMIAAGYQAGVALDCIFAKARLAYDMKATEPVLNTQGIIRLKNARHPLIDKDRVVPVDIRLGDDFDTLIITGPNTGGKTVCLKTLGLLTLMAACGLMIPADENSTVAVFDQILCDIGDEQSIEQSLSTFSAHMTNMVKILQQADSDSLVLLDELGAGTDPVEGAALAASVLEALRKRGCRIAATTHYAELKAYALQTDGVTNGCCEFDVATLRPTYRLLIGLPGRSNAFAILDRLGMDAAVVNRARELISNENQSFEEILTTLQESHSELENEKAEAEQLRRQAAEQKRSADAARKSVEQEKERVLKDAKKEAERIVSTARSRSEALLAELTELRRLADQNNADQMVVKARAAAKSGMRRLEESADPVEPDRENYVLPRPLRAGDRVLISGIGKEGTVLETPDGTSVLVQAGIVKTKTPISSLRLIENHIEKHPSGGVSRSGSFQKTVESRASAQVDLRGMASDEALMVLEQFLSESVMNGLHEVTVIHGKGTGVLRTAVQQYLRKSNAISSFRLGTYGEGEDGVTIAQLK